MQQRAYNVVLGQPPEIEEYLPAPLLAVSAAVLRGDNHLIPRQPALPVAPVIAIEQALEVGRSPHVCGTTIKPIDELVLRAQLRSTFG